MGLLIRPCGQKAEVINLLTVKIDEENVRELIRSKVAELVKEVDTEYIFWDTKELRRRTCMSWNTMQEAFFNDPRFPKRKVGAKWYFPVRETRAFLEKWLDEQGQ